MVKVLITRHSAFVIGNIRARTYVECDPLENSKSTIHAIESSLLTSKYFEYVVQR